MWTINLLTIFVHHQLASFVGSMSCCVRVPDDPLVHDDCQGKSCRAVSGNVPNDCWVPNEVLDDPLIRDGC